MPFKMLRAMNRTGCNILFQILPLKDNKETNKRARQL